MPGIAPMVFPCIFVLGLRTSKHIVRAPQTISIGPKNRAEGLEPGFDGATGPHKWNPSFALN